MTDRAKPKHKDDAEPNLADAVAARRPLLVKQARRMLRDGANAEDVVQDAIIAALKHLDNFRGDAQLGTWLYRVGANAVLMGMRRDRRAADRTTRASANLTEEANWLGGVQSGVAAQQYLEQYEQAELLRWAVEQLPAHYRCVVMLCDLNEQPLEEVARSLDLTPGGVRTRRLRAHRMLRATLEGRSERS